MQGNVGCRLASIEEFIGFYIQKIYEEITRQIFAFLDKISIIYIYAQQKQGHPWDRTNKCLNRQLLAPSQISAGVPDNFRHLQKNMRKSAQVKGAWVAPQWNQYPMLKRGRTEIRVHPAPLRPIWTMSCLAVSILALRVVTVVELPREQQMWPLLLYHSPQIVKIGNQDNYQAIQSALRCQLTHAQQNFFPSLLDVSLPVLSLTCEVSCSLRQHGLVAAALVIARASLSIRLGSSLSLSFCFPWLSSCRRQGAGAPGQVYFLSWSAPSSYQSVRSLLALGSLLSSFALLITVPPSRLLSLWGSPSPVSSLQSTATLALSSITTAATFPLPYVR